MSKWKCEICGKEFDNFHAQGFDNKIYCPLCFFKEENRRLKDKINTYEDPEDLTLMFMYCDEKAKDKIKQLKELINGIREERDYLFNKSSVENKQIQQEKDLYKSVIEEVREYVNTPWILADYETGEQIHKKKKELLQILDKAKEVK